MIANKINNINVCLYCPDAAIQNGINEKKTFEIKSVINENAKLQTQHANSNRIIIITPIKPYCQYDECACSRAMNCCIHREREKYTH